MSDAISAASLLMAVVAILYGAWYQEIIQATKLNVPKHDKQIPLLAVNNALFFRSLPLALMAVVVFFVFLPNVIEILLHSISVLEKHGLQSYLFYDSVRTAFCLVVFVGCGIGLHVCFLTKKLFEMRRQLKE